MWGWYDKGYKKNYTKDYHHCNNICAELILDVRMWVWGPDGDLVWRIEGAGEGGGDGVEGSLGGVVEWRRWRGWVKWLDCCRSPGMIQRLESEMITQ